MIRRRVFKTVSIDSPWMERGGGKVKRGADRHYPLLPTHKIIETILTCPHWADVDHQAHLYLWYTNNFLPQALQVGEALGFRYVTQRTWAKDRIGLGQYWRGRTEHAMFFVRGRTLAAKSRKLSTLIGNGIVPRGRHSEKPAVFYEEVEQVSPGPYLELFAREARAGWTVWGNEVDTKKKGKR